MDLTNFTTGVVTNSSLRRSSRNNYSSDNGLTNILITMGIFGVLGFLSNIGVFAVMSRKKHRNLPTNRYLVNLAISDIVMSIFTSLKICANLRLIHWNYTLCKVYMLVRYFPMFLSINIMVLISLERFIAIVYPIRFKAFTSSRMVNLQLFLVYSITAIQQIFPQISIKLLMWGQYRYCNMYRRIWIFEYMFSMSMIGPSLLILPFYTIIMINILKQNKLTDENKASEEKRRRRNVHLVLVFSLVTGLFLICWFPVWILSSLLIRGVPWATPQVLQHTSLLIHLHALVNPVVYFSIDPRFKKEISILFKKNNSVSITSNQ